MVPHSAISAQVLDQTLLHSEILVEERKEWGKILKKVILVGKLVLHKKGSIALIKVTIINYCKMYIFFLFVILI